MWSNMPLHLPAQNEPTICEIPAAISRKPRATTEAMDGTSGSMMQIDPNTTNAIPRSRKHHHLSRRGCNSCVPGEFEGAGTVGMFVLLRGGCTVYLVSLLLLEHMRRVMNCQS